MFIIPPSFIIPFATNLVVCVIFERFLYAVLGLFLFTDNDTKRMKSEMLISACIQFLGTFVSHFAWMILRVCVAAFSFFSWILLLVILLSILYVSWEEYSELYLYALDVYNDTLSPLIQNYVIIPVQLLNILYKSVCPLYNMVIWFGKVLFQQGLVLVLLRQLKTVTRFMGALLLLARHLVASFQDYLHVLECKDNSCLTSESYTQRFDMLTPLQDVRNAGVMIVELGQNICTPLNIPIGILMYPVLERLFAQSFDCFFNAFLQGVVQIPIVTVRRCTTYSSYSNLYLMCCPDFEPLFLELLQGLSMLGKGLDRWIQYILRIVTGSGPCTETVSTNNTQAITIVLSGHNAMAGMGEDWMGVTNGTLAVFHQLKTQNVAVKSWGSAASDIDPTFGVASVYYTSVDQTRTTLFGCNCTDTSTGILVLCKYLALDHDEAAGQVSTVSFQDDTWRRSFTCDKVEISVRPVRFSVRRFEASNSGDAACLTRNTCESIDATLWLVPKCTLLTAAVCNPYAVGTNCYPFCMATRVSGSKNSPLVFINAQDWRTGRQVLYQECSSLTYVNALQIVPDEQSYLCKGSTSSSASTFIIVNSTLQPEQDSYIRSAFQPFAITGETLLVAQDAPDGRAVVYVERLTGNQQDVYSLAKTSFTLDAAPRQNIPADEFQYNPIQQVYVPLEFQARRIYATSSEKYVFYAQSPNLELFGAFFDYCREPEKLPRFQFMLFSSYAPMRIYRVRAYCQTNCIGVSAQVTLQGFSDPNDLSDEAKTFQCNGRRFNASFAGIEYVDSNNIAVMVQEADQTYDAWTDSGTNSSYRIYWLHPDTLQLHSPEQGRWTSSSSSSSGNSKSDVTTCPDIIALPYVGRLTGLILSTNLHLVRFGVNAFFYTPGVVYQWRTMGSQCPSNALGHSVIKTCARYVYSLDDYFDNVDQCSEIVWSIVRFLSDLLQTGKEPTTLQKLLQGLSAYGRAMDSTDIPIMREMQSVFTILRTQNVILSSGGSVTASITAWTRFGYLFVHDIGINFVKSALTEEAITKAVMWRSFTNAVYELQATFDSVITIRGKSGCVGLQIMLGGSVNNPWAQLVYHVCMSSHELASSLLRFFTTLFVQLPLLKCVCVDAALYNPKQYILQQCIPNAPQGLKPMLIDILHMDTCAKVVVKVQTSLESNFQPWFYELYQALDALGNSVDYAMIAFDPDAGQCLNYQTNPNVIVVIPEPVDYFQACATTVSCHSKCSGTWDLLQTSLEQYQDRNLTQSILISDTIESMFFPYPAPEMVALGDVLAISQTTPQCIDASDQYIMAAFSKGLTGEIILQSFCVPSNPLSPVTFGVPDRVVVSYTSVAESILKGYFVAEDGSKLVFTGMQNSLMRLVYFDAKDMSLQVVLDPSDVTSPYLWPLLYQGMRSMQLIDFMVVHDKIVLSVGVRVTVNGKYQAQKTCLFLDIGKNVSSICSLADALWKGYSITEKRVSDLHLAHLILWPTSSISTVTPFELVLQWNEDGTNLQVSNIRTLTYDPKNLVVSFATKTLILSKFCMEDLGNSMLIVYAVDPNVYYDWLKQLRILYSSYSSVSAGTLYNSQTVYSNVTVVSACDGVDCRGCPTSQLHSICMAYQGCSIMQCVGTAVNLNRPLCNVGNLLKSLGSVSIVSVEGAYTIFCKMVITAVYFSKDTKQVSLTWADESFFGYVCTAKDTYADIAAVLTSSVNQVVQLAQSGHAKLQRMQAVDASANIALSLSVSAITGFLYQILLWPVYSLTVVRTILVCQIQGLISLLPQGTFQVSIVSPRFANATDAIAGMCLSQAMMTKSMQTGEPAVRKNFGKAAGRLLTMAGKGLDPILQLEPAMHMLDGALAYIAGIIYKFGDVVKSFYLKKCLVPNVLASELVQCSCGDMVVKIPETRAQAKEPWCTGTLFLAKPDGTLKPVYNPYSFSELSQKLPERMYLNYLQCLETSLDCIAPNDPVFAQQGFNLVQVVNQCRKNFAQKQMDAAAYLMYDQGMLNENVLVPVESKPMDQVGECLLYAFQQGITNGACFDSVAQDPFFWKYDVAITTIPDGCIAFSGPSQQDKRFKACLQDYQFPGVCEFSNHLWSATSTNTVPVAFPHILSENVYTNASVLEKYQAAYDLVVPLLQQMRDFDEKELDVGFFSAEGDLIHQTLDCIYLGPYARMDYWPQMNCVDSDASNDCLRGLLWARDENKGKLRGVDTQTCSKTKTLPFTCGSPNRKALIKYFVNMIILGGGKGNAIMNELIRKEIQDLEQVWSDLGSYANYDLNTYLPKSLSGSNFMYFNTTNVLGNIESKLEILWNQSRFLNSPWTLFLSEIAPEELLLYNWTAQSAHWVERDARYDTTNPGKFYNSSEAMHPPIHHEEDPTLWENCHGALQQVLFTMPTLDSQNMDVKLFSGGGPDAIQEHISELTKEAMRRSPLYRHYLVSHKPSMSKMCANASTAAAAAAAAAETTRSLTFTDFSMENNLLFSGSTISPIPVLGFHNASIGQATALCFCGWLFDAVLGKCIIPASVCTSLRWSTCTFDPSASFSQNLSHMYMKNWSCPLWEFSEHFGFLDREGSEAWIRDHYQTLSTSSEALLRYGPGGIRVGNVAQSAANPLREVWKNQVSPNDRVYDPIENGPVYGCGDDIIDTLFPMSQGISTSTPQSYCLRFAMEWSRFVVLSQTQGNTAAAVEQEGIAQTWKRRCGSQVQLIALCQSLHMYVPNEVANSYCNRMWKLEGFAATTDYLTPNCLMNVNGVFYDPCTCDQYKCSDAVITKSWLLANCQPIFNPMSVVMEQEMGWWEDETQNEWLRDPFHLLDYDAFLDQTLGATSANSFNTNPNQDWTQVEGYMRDNSPFCDYIHDYWPEESLFPVGYHVTMPCMQEDIGYRSFDNVFALDFDAVSNDPILRYMEDQTRDKSLIDSHFGSGGVCRLSNYGFTMVETNTMRVCTKAIQDEQVDIHIPLSPKKQDQYMEETCSTSSQSLPWTDVFSSIHSVGVVPNLPTSGNMYPETGHFFQVGDIRAMEQEGWGAGCEDYPIPLCNSDQDCPSDFRCFHQVCLAVGVMCLSHGDCSGTTMCNGMGQCVEPFVSVWNEMNESMEFRAASYDPGRHSQYSMVGGSHWAYVPDLLEAHGMCSYRHWREYLHTFDTCSCKDQGDGSTCQMQSESCTYYNFMIERNPVQWWQANATSPNRLKLMPTTCDRDYERMTLASKELKHVYLSDSDVYFFLHPSGQIYRAKEHSNYVQTYDMDQKKVAVRYMPFRSNVTYGFLGNSPNLQTCGSVKQCYADVFYVNGKTSMMLDQNGIQIPYRRLSNGNNYSGSDIFQCGFIGYMDKGVCYLDTKLFPLYKLLCVSLLSACQNAIDQVQRDTVCSQIQSKYPPSHAVILSNVKWLIQLFYVFITPTTLTQHINCVECFTSLFTRMQDTSSYYGQNLYFPLEFTAYEFPLSWLYQCMLASKDMRPDGTNNKQRLYFCNFYTNRVLEPTRYTPLQSTDSFQVYIHRVQGGYTLSAVQTYLQTQVNASVQRWINSVERARTKFFGVNKKVTPSCYTQRSWNIQNTDNTTRMLIYMKTRGVCDVAFANSMRRSYNDVHPTRRILTPEDDEIYLTSPSNLTFQFSNPTDLLEVIKKWGVDYIKNSNQNMEQYLRAIQSGMQSSDKNPVKYHMDMPDVSSPVVMNTLLQMLLKNNEFLTPYGMSFSQPVNDQCEESKKVLLFYDKQDDPLFRDIKVCPVYDTGKFYCSYPEYSGATAFSYQDVQLGRDITTYFVPLYSAIYSYYQQSTVAANIVSLPVSLLNFYTYETFAYKPDKFQFDLTLVMTYQNNINPDTSVEFMCVLGENRINFTQCTNPHYLALQDHVKRNYVKKGPVIIPAYEQLDWIVDRALFLAGTIFSFAQANRALDRTHLIAWLNNETVCNGDNININDRMCQYTGTSTVQVPSVVSPWTLGDWNPGEKCDVYRADILDGYQEVIDVYCYYLDYCPLTSEKQPDITKDYYTKMPFFDSVDKQGCRYKQNKKSTYVNVRDDVSYNLCRSNLFHEDELCLHTQGMLGGSDGRPTFDTRGLYEVFELNNLTVVQEGYLNNPLFRGSDQVDYGFLKMKSSHLGGHHLGIRIVNGTMTVFKMPLGSVLSNTFMHSWESLPVQDWLTTLFDQWKTDFDVYSVFAKTRDTSRAYAWDCPLRRRAFYAGSSSVFHPFLPSSRRSAILFGNMTSPYIYAHPTQQRKNASMHLGRYITSNGFCFCPVTEEVSDKVCQVGFNQDHNCSLVNTILALSGTKWVWSHTFLPKTKNNEYKPCSLQLDWPFVQGSLRDGSAIHSEDFDDLIWKKGSDVESKRCHLLDRLSPFQYMYRSTNVLTPRAGVTTLHQGVCHTGRVQRILSGMDARCVRAVKGLDQSTLLCDEKRGYTVNRVYSYIPFSQNRGTRQFCNKCSPIPRFESRSGFKIDPESSFGIPYRKSVEKNMMKDIKTAVCGSSNGANCTSKGLNESAWKPGVFLPTFLKNPEWLFGSTRVQVPVLPKPTQTDWDPSSQWVYCPTTEALRTGKNCTGSIPRDTWKANRVRSCHSTMHTIMQGQPDPMAKTSICDISKSLSELCNRIEQAKKLIQGVNCIRSGDKKCAVQEYVYTPATWDTSNMAFVHQTVEEYYQRMNSSVCPTTSKMKQILAENGNTLLQCPAMPLYATAMMVNSMRDVVLDFCDLVFQFVGVISNLVLSIYGSNSVEAYKARFIAGWQELQRGFSAVTSSLSDVMTDTIFTSGIIGVWVQKLLRNLCSYINRVFSYLHSVYCKLIVVYFPAFFSTLQDVGSYIDSGFTVLNDFINVILKEYLPEAMLGMVAKGYDKAFQAAMVGQKKQAYQAADKIKLDAKKAVQKEVLTAAQKDAAKVASNEKTVLKNMADPFGNSKNTKKTISKFTRATGAAAVGLDTYFTAMELMDNLDTAMKIQQAIEILPDYWSLFDFTTFQKIIEEVADFIANDVFCYNYVDSDNVTEFIPCSWIRLSTPAADSLATLTPYASQCWADAQVQDVGVSTLYACTGTSICCKDSVCSEKVLCIQCPLSPDSMLFSTFGCNTMTQMCQCSAPKLKVSRCLSHKDCSASDSACSLITNTNEMSYGSIRCSDCSVQSVCLVSSSSRIGQCVCLSSVKTEMALCRESATGESVLPQAGLLCGYETTMQTMQRQYYWPDIALVGCSNLKNPVCVQVFTPSSSSTFYLAFSNQLQSVTLTSQSRRRLLQEESWPDAYSIHDPFEQFPQETIQAVLRGSWWNHTGTRCAWFVQEYLHHNRTEVEYAAMQCAYWRIVARKLIDKYNLTVLRSFDHFLLSPTDFAWVIAHEDVWKELIQHPKMWWDILFYSPWSQPLQILKNYYIHVPLPLAQSNTRIRKQQKQKQSVNHSLRTPPRKLLGYIEDTDKVLDQVFAAPFFIKQWFPVTLQVPIPGTCLPVDILYSTGRDVVMKLVLYYQHMNFEFIEPNTPFLFALPIDSTPLPPLKAEASIWSMIIHALCKFMRFNPRDLLSVQFRDILTSFTYCNVDAVMFCNKKQSNIVPALGLVLLMYLVLYYIISPTLGNVFLFFCAPACTIYLTYQIAPGCFPMVPTCLLDEVIYNAQRYFPVHLDLPQELLVVQGSLVSNQTRSCTELGFKNVQDPLLYGLCQVGLAHWIEPYVRVDTMCNLPRETGYYFCAVISTVLSMPLVFLGIMIFVSIFSLATFVVSLLPSMMVVLYHVIVFDHQ